MANWRRTLKLSTAAVAAGGTMAAGGYGIAAAATPAAVHHHARAVASTVAAVASGSFTLERRGGRTETILTTPATPFQGGRFPYTDERSDHR